VLPDLLRAIYSRSNSFFFSAKTENSMLDNYSLTILSELQRDSRQTVQQLADTVGLSASPCWKRVKDMEATGVIRGYTARVDAEKVGLGLRVIVEANLEKHSEALVRQFERAVAACPQIVQCLSTTGQSDYLMTVLVSDIKRYDQFLHDTLFKLPGITHVRSAIVLKEIKAEAGLPVEAPPEAARPRSKRS
jgi:DNA-binding Lrp family transcriptional regulator